MLSQWCPVRSSASGHRGTLGKSSTAPAVAGGGGAEIPGAFPHRARRDRGDDGSEFDEVADFVGREPRFSNYHPCGSPMELTRRTYQTGDIGPWTECSTADSIEAVRSKLPGCPFIS